MTAEVDCRDLTVEYVVGGYRVRPFEELELGVDAGEIALLLGSSGCGKTTLLSVLAGLLTPLEGTVRVAGVEVTSLGRRPLAEYRRRTVGIVFQAYNLVAGLTAVENVELPLLGSAVAPRSARERACALLERVGLSDRLDHRPGQLSGGQQQRVAIARALALEPPVLLADEPTAHLDYTQVEAVLRLLRELAGEGKTVMIATHDERLMPLGTQTIELSPQPVTQPLEPVVVELAAGEVLFRQGDTGERAYLVEEGEIEIVKTLADGSDEIVSRIGAGGNFGELAPMFGLRRSATARAAVATRLVGLSASHLPTWLARQAADRESRGRE
jgi:putative ABC transport system ATP-binding protein